MARSSPDNVNVTANVIHAAIYDARPDVHAIVHHHSPCVLAVACMEGGLELLTQDGSAFLDHVAYHEWEVRECPPPPRPPPLPFLSPPSLCPLYHPPPRRVE